MPEFQICISYNKVTHKMKSKIIFWEVLCGDGSSELGKESSEADTKQGRPGKADLL